MNAMFFRVLFIILASLLYQKHPEILYHQVYSTQIDCYLLYKLEQTTNELETGNVSV